jgi:hypothetical protein
LQWHWGRSNRRQWQWGNGNDRLFPLQWSMDRVDVGRGARAWAMFIPCVLFETLVNAQVEVRLKEWSTWLTTLTRVYSGLFGLSLVNALKEHFCLWVFLFPSCHWDSSFTVPMNLMTPDKPNTVVSIDPLLLFHLATASFTTRFLLSQLYKHSTWNKPLPLQLLDFHTNFTHYWHQQVEPRSLWP